MSDIHREIQSLAPSALIELFSIDTRHIEGGAVSYFHAGTNQLVQPIVWQGITYYPLPIEAEGFDMVTKGSAPRPKIRVANIDGLFSAEVRQFDDLVDSKVTLKRTHVKYLDAVNFREGNPTANPAEIYPDQLWYVNRKLSESNQMIEWELVSAFDLRSARVPARQVIQNSCAFKYRGAECGYTGVEFFDRNDELTWDEKLDVCSKRFVGCQRRFPAPQIIRFGGFPGATRYEN